MDAEWATALDTLHAQAWKRLERGVADRRSPGRHPTLATVDGAGMPQARTVVLRAADKDSATLKIYSDRNADKVEQVLATPQAAIHIWDNVAHLQLRLITDVVVQTGESVIGIWDQLSNHARACYGFQPLSGEAVADGLAYEKIPEPGAFAVLELSVREMDVLHLGFKHRRARFSRANGWAGQWVVP